MGNKLMDKLLERKEARQVKEGKEVDFCSVGQQATLPMFHVLRDRIVRDLQIYAADDDSSIKCTQLEGRLAVDRLQFRSFHLDLQVKTDGAIEFRTVVKASAFAGAEIREDRILLVGTAQDEIVYRLHGKDYLDVVEVSEELLTPLLLLLAGR